MENAVPRIIEFLNGADLFVWRSIVTTLGEISKQRKRFCHLLAWLPLNLFFPAELAKVVENAVPRIVELLKHTESDVHGN